MAARLSRWQADADLATLRAGAALEKLSKAGRDASQRFWSEVRAKLAALRQGAAW